MNHIKHPIIYLAFCVLIIITFNTSCSKDAEIPIYSDFPTEVGKIIANKCANSGCHNNTSYEAAANLNLSSFANLFKGSVNGSPVIPYSSEFSSLCSFINTYPELGIISSPSMPINAKPLSKEEVITFKNWIDNGAPDIKGNVMWSDNPNRKKYYVSNQGCDVVTVFDANTQLPMRFITVGNSPSRDDIPHMVKVSPDGKYWYVIFVNDNKLKKYRTADDAFVAEVDLGKDIDLKPYNNWNTMTISPDSKKAYCVSWLANGRIASVDLETMKLIHNYGGYNYSHGSALNHTNDTLYITSQYGNFIYKIDTGFNSSTQVMLDMSSTPIYVPNTIDPHEIIFSNDGTKYFVTCQSSNEVRVMNTSDNKLLATIKTGKTPLEIVKSDIRQKLYVTCQDEPNATNTKQKGCVTVIDMNTFQSKNYPVGYEVHGIAVDEENGLLIVASRNTLTNGPTPHHTNICGRAGFVNYFNLNTMQLLKKTTELAADPYSVSIRP